MGYKQQPSAYNDQAAHEDLRTQRVRGLVHRDSILARIFHLPDSYRDVHEAIQLQVRNHLRSSAGRCRRTSVLPSSHNKGILGISRHLLYHRYWNVLPRDGSESLCDSIGRFRVSSAQAQPRPVIQRSWSLCCGNVPEQACPQRQHIHQRDPSCRLRRRMGRLYPDGD